MEISGRKKEGVLGFWGQRFLATSLLASRTASAERKSHGPRRFAGISSPMSRALISSRATAMSSGCLSVSCRASSSRRRPSLAVSSRHGGGLSSLALTIAALVSKPSPSSLRKDTRSPRFSRRRTRATSLSCVARSTATRAR